MKVFLRTPLSFEGVIGWDLDLTMSVTLASRVSSYPCSEAKSSEDEVGEAEEALDSERADSVDSECWDEVSSDDSNRKF